MEIERNALLKIAELFCLQKLKLATGESLTGGLVSASFSTLPGSSDFYSGGIVAYTRSAKHKVLGVSSLLLKRNTPYSQACSEAMAVCAIKRFRSHIGIGVTGLAGPGCDFAPEGVAPGTVFVSVALNRHHFRSIHLHLKGTREEIRQAAANEAVLFLAELISSEKDFVLKLNQSRRQKRITARRKKVKKTTDDQLTERPGTR
ncbi:MAG: CinA family protein [Candidatus Wallbacteria bacterium]|nr:CinA family protein [Candidatus Wallbacteria bacterium]